MAGSVNARLGDGEGEGPRQGVSGFAGEGIVDVMMVARGDDKDSEK